MFGVLGLFAVVNLLNSDFQPTTPSYMDTRSTDGDISERVEPTKEVDIFSGGGAVYKDVGEEQSFIDLFSLLIDTVPMWALMIFMFIPIYLFMQMFSRSSK